MTVLDLRRSAVTARQDLAFSMKQRNLPVTFITEQLGFTDKASTYRAIQAGRQRALRNEGLISDRMFGVEIEFNGTSRRKVVQEIMSMDRHFAVEVEDYNHRTREHWKLTTDSSVNGSGSGSCDCGDDDCEGSDYGEGNEAVSPILQGSEGFKSLQTMVKGIRAAGGEIDRSCGLHVHHDARDMSPEALAYMLDFYITNQRLIDSLLAPSRRSNLGNQWCRGYSEAEKSNLLQQARANKSFGYWDRYKTVNITSYGKYGSIEFRQHQGTLNIDKIENWVRFGQAIVETAIKLENTTVQCFENLGEMLDHLVLNGGLPRVNADWLLARPAQFTS